MVYRSRKNIVRKMKLLLPCLAIGMLFAQQVLALELGSVELKNVHVEGSTAGDVMSSLVDMMLKKGLEQTREKAAKGDPDAQYTLGEAYQKGQGVTQSNEEAAKWFTLAADQGHAAAQYYMGLKYMAGSGVSRSKDKAVKLFFKAAEQHYAKAQYELASYFGRGDDKDDAKKLKWLQRSAKNGNVSAITTLGGMYLVGVGGLDKDDVKGFALTLQAAQAGNAQAMENLQFCYFNGAGTKVDVEQRMFWLTKAAEKGRPGAQFLLGMNQKNGISWIIKSAEQGYPAAQFRLGIMYIMGDGAEKHAAKGFNWLVRAQGSGSKEAAYILNNAAKQIEQLILSADKTQAE